MLPFLGIQLIYVTIAVLKIEIIHNGADNVKKLRNSYDYIVVGLGSAGSVVAARLSEDKNIRVLGLEAGIPQSAFTDIPRISQPFSYLALSPYQLDFYSIPQKKIGFAYTGGRILNLRGKVIGGTSVINTMFYNRGNRKDYDNWAHNYGAIGWDYKSVLPYFIKAENNTDLKIVSDNPTYHGTKGPVGISSLGTIDPIFYEEIEALKSLGYKTTDINGPNQTGVAIAQMFIYNGLRSSSANCYLEPNPYPKNLFISLNSFVTKVIIENSKAIGVEFVKNNKTYRVNAKKEVIICAGTIQSPQILMLSGIGPNDHLEQMGIPVKTNLPVGNNLKDHVNIPQLFGIVNNCSKVISAKSPDITIPDLYLLYSNKSGVLSQLPQTAAYYNTKFNDDNTWPNTILYTFTAIFSETIFALSYLFDPNIFGQWSQYYLELVNKCTLLFVPTVVRIKSVGTIRLNTTNPFDPPLIDQNFLSNEEDLKNFIEIVRFAYFVMEATSLSSELTIPGPIPGCSYCPKTPVHNCDQYLECLIRQISMSGDHQAGTCRMGSIDRDDVVVDPRLRVKGIRNLRVADCSIMPDLVNSNTNAPAIMIGEYVSDLIKKDNLCKN